MDASSINLGIKLPLRGLLDPFLNLDLDFWMLPKVLCSLQSRGFIHGSMSSQRQGKEESCGALSQLGCLGKKKKKKNKGTKILSKI